jgi:hypothetical protein
VCDFDETHDKFVDENNRYKGLKEEDVAEEEEVEEEEGEEAPCGAGGCANGEACVGDADCGSGFCMTLGASHRFCSTDERGTPAPSLTPTEVTTERVNEVQSVTVSATGGPITEGQFKLQLTHRGTRQRTDFLDWNSSAETLELALEQLENVDGVAVTRSLYNAEGAPQGYVYSVSFDGPVLCNGDIPLMVAIKGECGATNPNSRYLTGDGSGSGSGSGSVDGSDSSGVGSGNASTAATGTEAPPGAPCTADGECASGACSTAGACTHFGSAGGIAVGNTGDGFGDGSGDNGDGADGSGNNGGGAHGNGTVVCFQCRPFLPCDNGDSVFIATVTEGVVGMALAPTPLPTVPTTAPTETINTTLVPTTAPTEIAPTDAPTTAPTASPTCGGICDIGAVCGTDTDCGSGYCHIVDSDGESSSLIVQRRLQGSRVGSSYDSSSYDPFGDDALTALRDEYYSAHSDDDGEYSSGASAAPADAQNSYDEAAATDEAMPPVAVMQAMMSEMVSGMEGAVVGLCQLRTEAPSDAPTAAPTSVPTTLSPTASPTLAPSANPTALPTLRPTEVPTAEPTAWDSAKDTCYMHIVSLCKEEIKPAALDDKKMACMNCIERWSLGLMMHPQCLEWTVGNTGFPGEVAHDFCAVMVGEQDFLDIQGDTVADVGSYLYSLDEEDKDATELEDSGSFIVPVIIAVRTSGEKGTPSIIDSTKLSHKSSPNSRVKLKLSVPFPPLFPVLLRAAMLSTGS